MRRAAALVCVVLATTGAAAWAGIVWEPATALTVHPSWSYVGYNNARCLVASGSELHVIWADYRYPPNTSEILYRRSTDAGDTWLPFARVSHHPASSDYPSLEVSDGIVHVVWQDARSGRNEIYLERSADHGATWSDAEQLTHGSVSSETPSLEVNGRFLHLAWVDRRDDRSNTEVYYKRSGDRGETWSDARRLQHATGNSFVPSLAAAGDNVVVIWHDERLGRPDIYSSESEDRGLTWSGEINLSNDPADSYSPFVAVTRREVHLIWQDGRNPGPYNHEIFYQRGSLPAHPRRGSARVAP